MGKPMHYIGSSKIGPLSAKRGIRYPQLRLPLAHSDAIGDIASIFETEHEGKRAFLIVTEREVLNVNTVLKQNDQVLKPEAEASIEQRLSAIESQIAELKLLLFSTESDAFTKIKNRWARGDSNARPSPCKGAGFSA
jgi:hypothetical protein